MQALTLAARRDRRRTAILTLLAGVFVGLFITVYRFVPVGEAWPIFFKPAALAFLQGKSPYSVWGFFNPPWLIPFLIPFALMSDQLGATFLFFLTYLTLGFAAFRLGGKPFTVAIFLLSPSVLHLAWSGNIEFLVALGAVMPPALGLFLVLLKPQVGGFVALVWLVEAYRKGKVKEVVRVFSPVAIAFMLSFLVYGLYPQNAVELPAASWNISPWPVAIPVGLLLLWRAMKSRKMDFAISSAPFLTPFLGFYSISIAQLGLVGSVAETVLVTVGLWTAVILGI